MGAVRDCEAIVPGLLAQPVNSLTALAFLFAGVVVVARTEHHWLGWALAATGVGSFLFHGPMPPGAEWIHDVTLAWLLLVVAGIGLGRDRWGRLPGLILLAALMAAFPILGDPVGVGLAGVAIGALVIRDRSVRTLGPMTLLLLGALVGRLGATGGPLCDPGSLVQAHGVWHLAAAAAAAWWGLARRP
ncbi:MAG TPA: hypothetical protein VG872_05435 [Acidimicrobiia bacterium]|jgi:hypothetical protein|nr:hypothetical protein [Acidimicrobiia bacterium]